MTEQVWNFAGIEGGAGEIGSAVQPPLACSTRARPRSRRWPSVWGGTGSEAYQAVQMRWDTTSAELNAALQNLAQTISEAGSTMAQTEAGVTGMF